MAVTKLILYECPLCHTRYGTEEYAERCEKSHIKPAKFGENIRFHQDQYYYTNYPDWIEIKFEDGETIRYKR